MIQIRKSQSRGHANHGWLDSYHTFSFADYYDPQFMGFGVLRVINEDVIDGGNGFSTHGHKDMEIVTYVISGLIEHKDTLGSEGHIRPGDVQRMSAGTGIRHSEFNGLKNEKTHLLQIWIEPEKIGIAPEYEQKSFVNDWINQSFVLVASNNGAEGSLKLNQDASIYAAKYAVAGKKEIKLNAGRRVWIQMIAGELRVNGELLVAGDGAACLNETVLNLQAQPASHFLLFDLP